jgi:signal transduction histidine kinase
MHTGLSACTPDTREQTIRIAKFINDQRNAIIEEWVAVADSLTPRDLNKEELLDAVREILDSIVHALESAGPEPAPTASLSAVAVDKIPELTDVGKAHASHRFTQRFSLGQMAGEYRALRANVTRRWLSRRKRRGETAAGTAQELARFNAAVDWSLASAIAWYDNRLRQQQEELSASDRNKNEFLAVLGHELRNPLAPLRTGMDLLERAQGNPELLDSVRPMMDRQLAHLSRLVDDLVDFARISRGEISLHVASIDLNAAVHAGVEQVAAAISNRRHRLLVELAKPPVPVLGDFDRLTQVVSNLLSNASKYMEMGGQITVTSSIEDDMAVVRVVDTGFGIPAEHLQTIFELFSQIPEHRARTGGGGLGIGLALARRLVELQRGSIEARSHGFGAGSEFIVKLPLMRAETRTVETEGVASWRSSRSRRVLVVDDNVDAANSLAILLREMGHNTLTAYDGKSAVVQAETFEPEIVFLDLDLPEINGIDVARKIRLIEGAERIRLYAVTGWNQVDDRRRTERAGFDGHLAKPVTAEQIEQLFAAMS